MIASVALAAIARSARSIFGERGVPPHPARRPASHRNEKVVDIPEHGALASPASAQATQRLRRKGKPGHRLVVKEPLSGTEDEPRYYVGRGHEWR